MKIILDPNSLRYRIRQIKIYHHLRIVELFIVFILVIYKKP